MNSLHLGVIMDLYKLLSIGLVILRPPYTAEASTVLSQENWEYLDVINNYVHAINAQLERISKAKDATFLTQAKRLLNEGILLSDAAISHEIVECDISNFRTLFLIANKLLLGVKSILILNSRDDTTQYENDIYRKIITVVSSRIDGILKQQDLSFTKSQRAYYKFIADLDKIITKLSQKTNNNHPLLLACEYIKYFLQFSMANADANDYLSKHEQAIKAYYKTGLALSASVGLEGAIEPTGIVKAGTKVSVTQATGRADRGAYKSSSIDVALSANAGLKFANIVAATSSSSKKQVTATGMNASQLLKKSNISDKAKNVMLKTSSEYKIFNAKRDYVLKMSKSLGSHVNGIDKLFKRYSGLPFAKLVFSYIDPKYNLEKTRSIGVSGSVKVSSHTFASWLNFKIEVGAKNIIYRKNNDIYNFIKNEDCSIAFKNYNFLRRIAVMCDKYEFIKAAYDINGECNEQVLRQCVVKYIKQHGDFKNVNDLTKTIEYYAEILQTYTTKDKKEKKNIRSIKSKIENRLKTKGRLDTLLMAYFIGSCYLVLSPDAEVEKENRDNMQSAFERIALLLEDSKAFLKRNKEKNKTCVASEQDLKISFANDILVINLKRLENSPYIYDNGLELDIDLDVDKINTVVNMADKIKGAYKASKDALEINGANRAVLCLDNIEDVLQKSKDRVRNKIKWGFKYIHTGDGEIFDRIIEALRNIRNTLSDNKKNIKKQTVASKIATIFSAKKKSDIVRFVFKEVVIEKKSKLEFIGIKTATKLTNSLSLGLYDITNTTPVDGNLTVGVNRFIDSDFIERNDNSLYLPIKNIIDYCFIKEADFGTVVSAQNIKKFITRNYPNTYLNSVVSNCRNSVFTEQIQDNLRTIFPYAVNDSRAKEELRYIDNCLYGYDVSADNVLDMLSIYCSLIYKYIAKPYHEKVYGNTGKRLKKGEMLKAET